MRTLSRRTSSLSEAATAEGEQRENEEQCGVDTETRGPGDAEAGRWGDGATGRTGDAAGRETT
ncbi:MAG: hypothetical protein ABR568_00615 [Pyrinomonadaceae bacterium]